MVDQDGAFTNWYYLFTPEARRPATAVRSASETDAGYE